MVASPYARKLAAEAGVDIGQATGSGPGGRIVAQDVQQLIESGGGRAPSAETGAVDGITDVSARSFVARERLCRAKGSPPKLSAPERLLQSRTTILTTTSQ